MTASINGHGEQPLTNGLISGHCYTLVGAQRMNIKNGGGQKRLIQIRSTFGLTSGLYSSIDLEIHMEQMNGKENGQIETKQAGILSSVRFTSGLTSGSNYY